MNYLKIAIALTIIVGREGREAYAQRYPLGNPLGLIMHGLRGIDLFPT